MLLSLVWYLYDLHNSPEAKLKRFVEKQSSDYYESKRAQSEREIKRLDEMERQFKELEKLYNAGTINKEFYDRTNKKLMDEVNRRYNRIRWLFMRVLFLVDVVIDVVIEDS